MMQQGAVAVMTVRSARAKPRRSALLAVTTFGAGIAVAIASLSWSLSAAAPQPTRTASRLDFHIIAADTFEDRASGTRYRLANIDTPDIGTRARCAGERDLGNQATAAVRVLFSRARSLEIMPSGDVDSLGRRITQVNVDGRDLGALLVARKLARVSSGLRQSWCVTGAAIR
jgi:endonuclease YncB( thermonuclease family)